MRKAFSIRRPNISVLPSAPVATFPSPDRDSSPSLGGEPSPDDSILSDPSSPRKSFSIRRQKSSARAPSTPVSTLASPKEECSPSLEDKQFLSPSIQRDPLYYDIPLIFLVSHAIFPNCTLDVYGQVEDTLFKIARGYFEKHSSDSMFRVTTLVGPRAQEVPCGLTDQQPLRLDGVAAAEFRCLLRAIILE